jgi:hypothetical protein
LKAGKKKDVAAVSNKKIATADDEARSGLVRMLDAHMSDMGTILNGELRYIV